MLIKRYTDIFFTKKHFNDFDNLGLIDILKLFMLASWWVKSQPTSPFFVLCALTSSYRLPFDLRFIKEHVIRISVIQHWPDSRTGKSFSYTISLFDSLSSIKRYFEVDKNKRTFLSYIFPKTPFEIRILFVSLLWLNSYKREGIPMLSCSKRKSDLLYHNKQIGKEMEQKRLRK